MIDEDEISMMLASLKSVEAPDNFEGRVRSEIAQRRRVRSSLRPGLLLAAKFAFPILLLLVIGGFLIVSNERTLSVDMVPSIDEGRHDVAVVEDPSSETSLTANGTSVNSSPAQVPGNRVGRNSRAVRQSESEDIALSPDDSTVFPAGLDPRKTTITNGRAPGGGSISPVDVLSMIGISSSCSSVGCLATSVREASIAADAGIRSGDLISAIDGRSISTSTSITGRFTVNELTVVRTGRKMTVSVARR